ncbi:hypothetical protein [Anaerobacillus alkaliphilus]|uniref:hypothetical protein n=1 Tax=Anaerobacillus alkaliphilus TaxID=1548597 RepID=UPI001375A549|nr:hypothetical protein [Anaerobacillus alkaliphilus]
MSEYLLQYGYLKLVSSPPSRTDYPTFKEQQVKLSPEEVDYLLESLKSYRMQYQNQNS